MIRTTHWQEIITNDRLVLRIRLKGGRVISQGKRVGKDCPLSPNERRAYVQGDAISAVKIIRANRNLSLTDSMALLNQARFYITTPPAR
jgi:hypothetical protein